WSRSPLDWALGVSAATTAGLCALAAAGRLARILIGTSSPGSRPGVLAALRTASARGTQALAFAQAVLLCSVLLIAKGLLFDARYRPLFWPLFAAPAVLFLALTVLGDRLDRGAWLERALAAVCAISAVVLVAQEGLVNTQALGLALIWLALAVAVGWPQSFVSASGTEAAG
ncbi:MAG: hypothetical protein WBP37_16685, partial [Candidatus Dechloromonas phosphoritropha]